MDYVNGSLGELRHHWSGAYLISGSGGTWQATRLDDGRVLTADSADELRDAIRVDYLALPVQRAERAPGRHRLTAEWSLGDWPQVAGP